MSWVVKRADTFIKYLKKHKKHHDLFIELDKKIKRLQQDPEVIGGNLSGALHGLKSTRITGNFRLIFRIDKENKVVYLVAVDHRGDIYS